MSRVEIEPVDGVRIEKDRRTRTLLFDTGVSPGGMVENMRRLGAGVVCVSRGSSRPSCRRPVARHSRRSASRSSRSDSRRSCSTGLATGEVNRTTAFETGFQGHEALRGDAWRADPLILDDQALGRSIGSRCGSQTRSS